jgi:hypothetical protein
MDGTGQVRTRRDGVYYEMYYKTLQDATITGPKAKQIAVLAKCCREEEKNLASPAQSQQVTVSHNIPTTGTAHQVY